MRQLKKREHGIKGCLFIDFFLRQKYVYTYIEKSKQVLEGERKKEAGGDLLKIEGVQRRDRFF